jgi:cardiolipin synthase
MLITLAILVGIPVLVLALVGARYLTRGTPVHSIRSPGEKDGVPAISDERFRPTIELLSKMSMCPGNDVELLLNGDGTYPRLFADLRAATESITMQMYYCQPGRVADDVKAVLCDRARAGVRVLFLHDAIGSSRLEQAYIDELCAAGVEISTFRPVKWYALEKAYNRSHIRVVVIDGRIGYTGGFGIDDKWLGNGRRPDQWRETNARFSGPAVLHLQATFAAGWAEATGELLVGDLFFPDLEAAADGEGALAAVLHTAPTIGSTAAERFLALSIAGARRTLYISNAYFVPDDDFVGLLRDAVRRGVDVRVLTAGEHNDVKSTWYAGRAHFDSLLSGGVRIYEYSPSMIHAKTLVVDNCWSSVGTMNFDNRSLAFNDESNLLVLDERFGRRLHDVFLEDLEHSREITLEVFRRRPVLERALEWGASRLARVL